MKTASAFTLIELLVVMAVLGVIVTLVVTLMVGGRRIGGDLLRTEDVHRSARTVIDNLTWDLGHAIADSNLTFAVSNNSDGVACYGVTCSTMDLVVLSDDTDGTNRAARSVQYWIEPADSVSNSVYRLMRASRPLAADWSPAPFSETGVVVAGVAAFVVGVSSAGIVVTDYASTSFSNRLPAYADIYLELLDPGVARRAAVMSEEEANEFVGANALHFAARVALDNRFAEDTR